MRRKAVSILLAMTVISSLVVGCGKKETDTTPTEKVEATEVIETESTETTEVVETENTETTEVVETETQEPTETAEQSPYSFKDMTATMYAQRAVNVRDLPDTSGNKVGGLSTNDEVAVTGQCNETGWYRISYNGGTAYVSNSYLSDSKVENTKNTNSNSSSQSSTGTSSTNNDSQSAASSDSGSSNTGSTASKELPSNPYPLNTLVEDTGSSVSFYCLETFTNGVSNGYPNFYDTAHQATEYIMNMGKTPGDEVCNGTVGEYKEGIVWKWTCYYN